MKSRLGKPLSWVISRSSNSESLHVESSHPGVSMKPSSSSPSLHRKYSNVGLNGLKIFGNRHAMPNLLTILAFAIANFDWTVENLSKIFLMIGGVFLSNFLWALSIFCPSLMIGLGHEWGSSECEEDDWRRDIVVRGMSKLGSLKRAAVAGTVLGIKNPVSARLEENTANTTAPEIPLTKAPTCAATSSF